MARQRASNAEQEHDKVPALRGACERPFLASARVEFTVSVLPTEREKPKGWQTHSNA